MGRSLNIELNDEQADLIDREVDAGRIDSPEQAINEALAEWAGVQRARDRLRAEIEAGKASGPGIAFDPEDIRRRARQG